MATIEADFEKGVLRPTEKLALREGERVRLVVLRQADPSRWDLKRLAVSAAEDAALAEAGLESWADALDAQDRK
jgi:predicted DNA-binding antitoxin AbrB/MazE fold protein